MKPAPRRAPISRACSRRRAEAADSNWSGSPCPGSIHAAANGESAGRLRNRNRGFRFSQDSAAGASSRSSSTSRRVSRSRGWSGQTVLIERVQAGARPVKTADSHAAAGLGVVEDHQCRGGNLPEAPRQKLAPVQTFENVIVESLEVK